MSEQNSPNEQAMAPPVLRLQKMYVKDLSFENPNAPDVFLGKQLEPKVEVQLGIKNRKLDDTHWEVVLNVTAKIMAGESDKTLFLIEIEHAGVFMLQNIPEQHMAMVLSVECPTILFPFTRQIASQIAVDGGFMPFLLEPVNFLALFENARKNAQGQKEQQQ
ncbi:MAG: protein-export chaperone SecB [Deltaproteobacteria bacterium RIFOXYD12_FULL_50_9]|nr:MAG: protein-export chaperone SecB [Deltaproteobacteria bacterium RIFOXYD12_FULL_50_9]